MSESAAAEGRIWPGRLRVWLLAIRPATLGAGVAPVLVGGALAWREGRFIWPVAAACMLVAALLQIGANLANDYFDGLSGVDADDRLGPPRATQLRWCTPRQVAWAAAIALGASAAPGVYLLLVGGWPVIVVGALCVFGAVTYSGAGLRYGYRGFGDLAVLFFFGPVAVCGTAFLQTRRIDALALVASLPTGLLITAILVVNNIRDRRTDARAQKRTLAVRLGLRRSRLQYALLLAAAYLLPAAMVIAGRVTPGWLGGWLSMPLGLLEALALRRKDGAALNPHIGGTARLALIYSALFSVGVATW